METFEQLKDKLKMTNQDRLMLETVPMVLMPRWFFVAIKKQVESRAGLDISREVFYAAGYEGATLWTQTQMREAGLTGRQVMEQYLGSASLRGWGQFQIQNFEEKLGEGLFRLHHSAVAEETGDQEEMVCDHITGAMAGAVQAILDNTGYDKIKVVGREIKCESKGDQYCEFVVEPLGK